MMATLTKQGVRHREYPYNLTTKPTIVTIELPSTVEVEQTASQNLDFNDNIEGQ